MSAYTEQAVRVHHLIVSDDFFVDLWHRALRENGMTVVGFEQQLYSDEMVHDALFEFWDLLPDSPAIQTSTFHAICDLCDV